MRCIRTIYTASILIVFATCGVAFASDLVPLPNIPLKSGFVFRGVGPRELALPLNDRIIQPDRIRSGAFTPAEVTALLRTLSAERAAAMFSVHQTGVDAVQFTGLSDREVARIFSGTKEGELVLKDLIQKGRVDAGGFVISASENPAIAELINRTPGYSGYSGPAGTVLVIKKDYYGNLNPAFVGEAEIFLNDIAPKDIFGIVEDGKFYTLEDYKLAKSLEGRSFKEIRFSLQKAADNRYAMPLNSSARATAIQKQMNALRDLKYRLDTAHISSVVPIKPVPAKWYQKLYQWIKPIKRIR